MWTNYLFLAIVALLPIVASFLFHLLNKYTKFNKLPYWAKQVICGVIFGGLAIVGTHWSIKFNGYAANARDSAVIIGGLIFGGPAGIIAGTLGGLERMIMGLVDPTGFGFTVIACSVSTFLAGIVSALIRRFVFENKRPRVVSGFFTGLVIEVFHLFMVFVTNASQYEKAYNCIVNCTAPMLIANSISVLIALFVAGVMEEGKGFFKKPDTHSLTRGFTYTLSGLTFVAFILSSVFVYVFDDKMATQQRDNNLAYAISETSDEISYKTVEEAYNIKRTLDNNPGLEAYKHSDPSKDTYYYRLGQLGSAHGIAEINIIKLVEEKLPDEKGVLVDVLSGYIERSSVPEYADKHFKMNDNDDVDDHSQSRDFHAHMIDENGPGYYVQNFRKPVNLDAEERKYAGVLMDFDFDGDSVKEKGYLQVGYNKEGVDSLVGNVAYFKNVGNTGSLVVLNDKFEAISFGKDSQLPKDLTPLINAIKTNNQEKTFLLNINDVEYYIQYKFEDTHYIVSILPEKEAALSRNISIFINTFLEIIVFGLFFVTIFILVKKLVIDRIEKTNASLAKITQGKLDTIVEGGPITEFQVLAKDINETVDALKGYIDAANKRIDEELAMAKAIQSAVLPSTFPAFPDRKEFDIYASMHPAKVVGGDFYDFYFSNQEHFHFTIADVSGKGIPAALFMMRAKSVLKSLTQTNIPINEVFAKGNNNLCEGNEAGMFVTAWSASIDLTNGELTFANGGHNPPLIKHKNGKFEYLRAPVNLVLAAMDGMPYGINKLKLEIGDVVYLYTDGVTEGVNTKGEQLGEERLLQILNAKEFSSCKELCDYAYEECVKFADGAAQFDDITMVAFRFDGYKK